MGLMLSVLVACVGVAELLAFYANVRRSLVTVTTQTELDEISRRYRQELAGKSSDGFNHNGNNNSVEKCGKFPSEDVEGEFAPKILEFESKPPECARARSKSPGKLLPAETSPSTSKNIPTFLIEEKSDQRFAISSQDESPLPSRFFAESTPSAEYFSDEGRSRSPSPIPRRFVVEDGFKRSSSPYPPAVLPNAPRNSVCSELFDNDATTSVKEVDEDALSKSPSPERGRGFSECGNSRNLMVPGKKNGQRHKSESFSEAIVHNGSEELNNKRSASETRNRNEVEDELPDQNFLNSLDGVSGKKISRHSASRKSKKVRNKSSIAMEENVRDDVMSSSSYQNNEIAKTLTEASNVLKSINSPIDDESGSSTINKENGGHKPPEAFWVKDN